ncbi:uncharacterized protein BBA_03748 [Beauveria bassiana ARSEF 2860]|uniref:Uncharacterized protein n=1 Tax=Beauveria bassiana (strain ARSEF 2860) TaxID=655819 RepID=J4KPB7_BEAB2|nr:uncharacterized protein BBA_03748 [Beauveria bassiana ARSEF 2860]EJP67174.1 hypothetical protein BBA_03748 [Beauveria bassiana ARSEF 2860]
MVELALPRGAHTILDLDINGLYILLSEQGLAYRWHWGLYLHKEKERGYALHITWPSDAVLAVPVDDAADANAAAARERWGPLTCRTWLLRTLSELHDEGYISIKPAATVEEVEEEALSLAGSNAADVQGGKQLGAKDKVYRSVYSVA